MIGFVNIRSPDFTSLMVQSGVIRSEIHFEKKTKKLSKWISRRKDKKEKRKVYICRFEN